MDVFTPVNRCVGSQRQSERGGLIHEVMEGGMEMLGGQ